GYALLPLVNPHDGGDRLTEQIKALRRSLASEMGFVMPAVRILDNVQLDANTYVIKVKEVEAGRGRVFPGQAMVMDPTGAQVTLPGLHTTEPTFGLPATWIEDARKEEAAIKGYTDVDAATVLTRHLGGKPAICAGSIAGGASACRCFACELRGSRCSTSPSSARARTAVPSCIRGSCRKSSASCS